MRRVTFDSSVVGKLTVNLSAANDAAIVSKTAAGGITVNGNPPACPGPLTGVLRAYFRSNLGGTLNRPA